MEQREEDAEEVDDDDSESEEVFWNQPSSFFRL